MAIGVDWANLIIQVPTTDMTLIDAGPPEIRELDADEFRLQLHAILANSTGIVFSDMFINYAPVSVGGIVLARVIEFINGYTIEFQDAQYTVNVVGANTNISDVKVQNQVSVNTFNSAGLVQLTAADIGNVVAGVWDELRSAHTGAGTFGEGVASVQGNITGNVLGNVSGTVGSVVTGVNVAQLKGSSSAADLLRRSALTMIGGTVDDTAYAPTTTQFESNDITDAQTNKYVGRVVIFEDTSTNQKAASDVIAYSLVSGRGHFTVTGFPSAPASGETFVIV